MRKLYLALAATSLLAVACGSADTEDGTLAGDEESTAWSEAYEENTSGKTDSQGCSGVIVPDRKGFQKRVALTFDDGPNLTTTPKVLEILANHNAKATFFVNGSKLTQQAQKDLLVEMQAAGHHIGNHTHNHKNMKLESASSCETQVANTEKLLEGLGLTQRYFRFPYGSSSCESAQIVRSHGYAITGWHIDSADWCYQAGGGYCKPSTFKYVDDEFRDNINGYVMQQAKSLNGGVLLFHDIHSFTASHLDSIMTDLENAGFSFVGLDDTGAFPLLNGATATPSAWVGTPCKTDAECKFSASGKNGACLAFDDGTGFCSLPCEGFCPDQSDAAPTFCTSLDDGATGQCVSKAADVNGNCSKIPGTAAVSADRFIGSSTATASTATVCLPK